MKKFMEKFMRKFNLETGRLGESIAKEHLENKGYSILEQNCRNKYGEIDLVVCLPAGRAKDKDTLVFVEVKTRIGEQFGIPEQSINRNKMYRLIKNAQLYLVRNDCYNMRYRIDAICIVLNENNQPKRINHYENITAT